MNKSINKLLILFFLLGILFNGCDSFNKKEEKPGKIICVLIDFSLSTSSNQIRDVYAKNLNMIITRINIGDALVAAIISDHSLTELNFFLEFESEPLFYETDNRTIKKAYKINRMNNMKVKRDSLLILADSLISHFDRRIYSTEILSALQVAERIFLKYEQPRKVLVILSDMVEESNYYDFRNEHFLPERINHLINLEQNTNRIPNLTGVKVYVAGATIADTRRFNQIREFWMQYFQVSHALLSPENYGSTLIKFNE
jgi:hypothetical protein